MNTVKFHPQGTTHLYVPFRRLATPCGWSVSNNQEMILSTTEDVTCVDCLEHMAAYQQSMGQQTVTLLNFHTDYGNDDACDTPLAIFSDPADAERHRATLTASLQPCERSSLSYNTETMRVLPKGADYTGGPYG